ncbi:MAG: FliH/SctL family protein, partial [Calditrichia bacterium]
MMTSSSKRILKLRRPIQKVVVLPGGNAASGKTGHGLNSEPEIRTDVVQVSRQEFQQELMDHYQKGLEEGRVSGYGQAEADYAQKTARLAEVVASFEAEKKEFFQKSEGILLNLILNISEKLLKEIPAVIPGQLEKTVQELLNYLHNETMLEISLHPDDLQNFESLRADFEKQLPNLEKLNLKSDSRITPGG